MVKVVLKLERPVRTSVARRSVPPPTTVTTVETVLGQACSINRKIEALKRKNETQTWENNRLGLLGLLKVVVWMVKIKVQRAKDKLKMAEEMRMSALNSVEQLQQLRAPRVGICKALVGLGSDDCGILGTACFPIPDNEI
ncbi:hypothetical protein C0Q70_00689 [Pomacea canaliculata]|uniref:Uncharacterized protein n=1 Tax=Pomacea canaliculata TaxID=400727 RepID=A0A2T7PXE7_POMCA|nr:hypothetical protein C0Q70_00689 [Pomacea canaliculata]